MDIEKASGDNAYRIEQIFSKKAELNGKRVVVKGKVVKISKYQGKIWLRIVDGSGSKKRGNHKLIVTTEQNAKKGAIIMISGVVRVNKLFGALAYEVVVEDAKVTESVL